MNTGNKLLSRAQELRALSRKVILTLMLIGLVAPLAIFINDRGRLGILAVVWLFTYNTLDGTSSFSGVIQSISTVVLWIWRFVFLYIFIQFYKRKMSLRQVKYGAILAQSPWFLAVIGDVLNAIINYSIGGRVTQLAVPLPFLVLACFLVLRISPRAESPEDWLDEKDSSWGPTINIDDETMDS